MRYLLILLSLLCLLQTKAQENDVKLPKIIPPSPEVGKLATINGASVGLHTGSANINIPLVSVRQGEATVNVSLNYNSNGIRVDDIPSRVGLGWSLVAGGMISRIVHDDPDGDVSFYKAPNLYAKDQTALNYLRAVSELSEAFDTEWDEYSYSFNGFSGKFFLDSNGAAYCIPHNKLRIQVLGFKTNSKQFVITAPDGIIYRFGMPTVERTRNLNISGGSDGGVVSKTAYIETAWFLDNIEVPQGSKITFSYTPVYIRNALGPYQTIINPLKGQSYQVNGTTQQVNNVQLSTGVNQIDYDTYFLSSFRTDDGEKVSFTYEKRLDSSGDYRLKKLELSDNNPSYSDCLLKQFLFEYLDPTVNNNSLNKRFYLSRLKQSEFSSLDGLNPTVISSLDHDFSYYDVNGLPPRLSYAQDWYGMYNGSSNTYFAPYISSISGSVVNATIGGNRNPGSITNRVKGSLSKITFPTGGSDSLIYEAHTVVENSSNNSYSTIDAGGSGINAHDYQTWTSVTIKSSTDQIGYLNLRSYLRPDFQTSSGYEGTVIFDLKVINYSNNTVVFRRRLLYYSDESLEIDLKKDTIYKLELTVWSEMNGGYASLTLNPTTTVTYTNKDVGGIRVKQILRYEPVTKKVTNKYFYYASISDLGRSSGVGPFQPQMHLPYQTGINLGVNGIAIIDNYMISSGTLLPSYSFSGSPIAYKTVIESDDPAFANGCTEHYFTTFHPGATNQTAIIGTAPIEGPTNISTDLNGTEYKTRFYRRSGSSNICIKETGSLSTPASGVYKTWDNLLVRRRYDDLRTYSSPLPSQFDGYDVIKYWYTSQWNTVVSTYSTEYDQNGNNPITITTDNTYSDTSHLQVTSQKISNSDNTFKIIDYKYPKDLAVASPINVYQKMVNVNWIQEPVETKTSYLSGTTTTFLNSSNTTYNDWFNNGKVIKPQTVQTRKAPTTNSEDRIRYHRYDAFGNPILVSKQSGPYIGYIWDYGFNWPTAEVKLASNAADTIIAYTSFEANGKGNWVFAYAPQVDATSPTGSNCQNLTNKNITRAISSSAIYLVTYWLKANSGTALINGSAGTLMESRNGWGYYEKTISAAATVTISGTGTIDELRLFPKGALMTTYTYKPNVGITSTCAPNNQITRYDYDGLGQLKIVYDADRKVLKKYQYAYKQPYTPCTTTAANWVITGVTRCVQSGTNNNYTGVKQREKKDMNNCSATYLNTIWETITTPAGECQPIANCTGEGYRVPTGGTTCVAGQKIFVYQTNLGGGVWECKYYYYWPQDNYTSGYYISNNMSACGLD